MNRNHKVECTRYGDVGEDQRVREALAYAVALSGGKMPSSALHSLHDHKGQLEALWTSRIDYVEFHKFIDRAWIEWACEGPADHFEPGPQMRRDTGVVGQSSN
jgi:hypothetical protein